MIAAGGPWDQLGIADMLHEENGRLGLKPKTFMTVLRHALTGMKVRFASPLRLISIIDAFGLLSQNGPGVPEIMRVLGKQRTSTRLKAAHPATLIN